MDDQAVIRTYGNTNLPEGTADRPLVTFALFAYNQEKYIREAVEGAFSQTYSPLEIILSDDCSSDRTFEIMEEMAREYRGPHLVKLRRNPRNRGTLSHVLAVAQIADGLFLLVAAGDDISLPERTATVVPVMLAASPTVAVASSDDVIFDDVGNTYDGEADVLRRRKYFKSQRGWFHGATACYRTDLLRRMPIPNSRILFEDMAFIAFFSHTERESIRIEIPLIRRRAHANNAGTIRLIEKQGFWADERRRLSNIASAADAYEYAASAIASCVGDDRGLRRRAAFLRSYAMWPEMRFMARTRLLGDAARYGYLKSVLIRLPGKSLFKLAKKLSSINFPASRA
jgi:glycosyltransferase involved in cell wall biosynthesis